MWVADLGGEEFEETVRRTLAGSLDQGRSSMNRDGRQAGTHETTALTMSATIHDISDQSIRRHSII